MYVSEMQYVLLMLCECSMLFTTTANISTITSGLLVFYIQDTITSPMLIYVMTYIHTYIHKRQNRRQSFNTENSFVYCVRTNFFRTISAKHSYTYLSETLIDKIISNEAYETERN